MFNPSFLPSWAVTVSVWPFRQGQLMVIIYETWSRPITSDGKSLLASTEWGWVCSVNSGTTVPRLLAFTF